MKKLFILSFLLLGGLISTAQKPAANPFNYPAYGDIVEAKNYFLLDLMEHDKVIRKQLENDPALAAISKAKLDGITTSLTECKDASCFTARLKFTDDEIATIGKELLTLCKPGSRLEWLMKTKVIPSYTYSLYKIADPAQLLVKAWEQDADGINYAISVYAEAKKPNYAQIDSISFNVKSRAFKTVAFDANQTLANELKSASLFFKPSLQAALMYIQLNGRTDPANYEPMESTVNKAAVTHAKTLHWGKYAYSVILIPGEGPEEKEVALSPVGMLRCRLAAKAWRDGRAPFIMPSGGKVHPYKTPYCEAEEMKKYLVNELHVPESAIIMEPHARHTTTNMRNAVRLIYQYNLPTKKPALVITDKSQLDAIMNMAARCERELKYVPYQLGKRLADTEVEFSPVPEAMQINSHEPLDP